MAVPPTVLLPHKEHPNGTSGKSMRNLEFPLDWESVFAAIGEHGFLKPIDGGGWRDVHEVRSREEFFKAYDQSRDLCMVYQKAVNLPTTFAALWWGKRKCALCPTIRGSRMPSVTCETRRARGRCSERLLWRRMEEDALKLCRALGYDLNSVEFAVENGDSICD